MVDQCVGAFKKTRVSKKCLSTFEYSGKREPRGVSECVLKTLACRGLRVGPSKCVPKALPVTPKRYQVLRSKVADSRLFSWKAHKASDILFPYRSPSPRPRPDPTQHPETDPKRNRNGAETAPNGAKRSRTEPNGAETDRNRALSGGTAGGVCRGGGGWGF